jgi:hypothetical protein
MILTNQQCSLSYKQVKESNCEVTSQVLSISVHCQTVFETHSISTVPDFSAQRLCAL